MMRRRWIVGCLAAALMAAGGPARAVADGDTLRWHDRTGPYRIAVFTAPTPLRAGPVHISVLLQDASTGAYVREAEVAIRMAAGERVLQSRADAGSATNKLLQAAVFELPEAGWWDIGIAIESPHGKGSLSFRVEAREPLPRWATLWPWFTWPAGAVALFAVHQALVRRRSSAHQKVPTPLGPS